MAKKPSSAASAKAAKQKKTLIVLSCVLLITGVYAFHTMQGLHGKTPSPVAASVVTTPGSTPSSPAATPTPAATATPASAPSATATTPSSFVLVAAVKPAAGTGQLQSFSRFESKDPFAANGPKTASASASSSSSSSGSASATGSAGKAAAPKALPTSAVIAVNGVAASVSLDADFPVSVDPTQNGLFHLVALTASSATVTVVGGSYASGAATLTLKVNQQVTLVNTADGTRYTLQLFPQGTPAPSAAAASGTTGATTTPTTP